MDRAFTILSNLLIPFAVGLVAVVVFCKVLQWVNRGQTKKWEGAIDDSRKSVQLQTEILAELKAVKELLEKR